MKAIVFVAVALLASLACAGWTTKTTKFIGKDGRERQRLVGRYTKDKALQKQLESALVGSGSTDPPVEQPHGMIVTVHSFCANQLNLAVSNIYNGGWSTAPAAVIYPQNSGQFVLGFEGRADPGNDIINASVTYSIVSNSNQYYLEMAFAAVQGEWEYEVVSETYWGLVLATSDVGKKALYSVTLGYPHLSYPLC